MDKQSMNPSLPQIHLGTILQLGIILLNFSDHKNHFCSGRKVLVFIIVVKNLKKEA